MSQHDLDLANQSGSSFRTDANNALKAIASTMKGASTPSNPQTGMLWIEDDAPSSSIWTLWCYDGADNICLGYIDSTNNTFCSPAKPTQALSVVTGTMDLGAKYSDLLTSASTTTVTSLGTAPAGTIKEVWHTAAQQYTYNATSLITPGAANYTTTSGDVLRWLSLGSGNWRCIGKYNVASVAGTVTSIATNNGVTGGTITGSGTIGLNTNNATGIGSHAIIYNLTGSSISAGATLTANGSNASFVKWNVSGVGATNGSVTSGQVWRNVSGGALPNNEAGLFQRVS